MLGEIKKEYFRNIKNVKKTLKILKTLRKNKAVLLLIKGYCRTNNFIWKRNLIMEEGKVAKTLIVTQTLLNI